MMQLAGSIMLPLSSPAQRWNFGFSNNSNDSFPSFFRVPDANIRSTCLQPARGQRAEKQRGGNRPVAVIDLVL